MLEDLKSKELIISYVDETHGPGGCSKKVRITRSEAKDIFRLTHSEAKVIVRHWLKDIEEILGDCYMHEIVSYSDRRGETHARRRIWHLIESGLIPVENVHKMRDEIFAALVKYFGEKMNMSAGQFWSGQHLLFEPEDIAAMEQFVYESNMF